MVCVIACASYRKALESAISIKEHEQKWYLRVCCLPLGAIVAVAGDGGVYVEIWR